MAHLIRFLSRGHVEEVLSMSRLIDIMGEGFQALSTREASAPQRTVLEFADTQSRALLMSAYGRDTWSLKTVSITDNNPRNGLPYIQALVYLVDKNTGRPLSIMDGVSITAMRTGAASGLATRLCARKDASNLAVFGSGGQAFHQIEAVCAVRQITSVLIFSRNPVTAEKLRRRVSRELDVSCSVSSDLSLLKEADIICTATTATEPLFGLEHVGKGTHINAIGAYRTDMCEIAGDLVHAARLVVDERASISLEAGDLIRAGRLDDLDEIGEVVTGKKPARANNSEITLFKSVGNAIQDLFAAQFAFREAEKRGIGIMLPFDS